MYSSQYSLLSVSLGKTVGKPDIIAKIAYDNKTSGKKRIYWFYAAFCSPLTIKETTMAAIPPTSANPPKM